MSRDNFFISPRVNTAMIVNSSIKKIFGEVTPTSDLYFQLAKLNQLICDGVEKEALKWQADLIRSNKEWEKKQRSKKKDNIF